MKMSTAITSSTLLAAFIAFLGCDIDSGDEVIREVGSTNISGVYSNSEGGAIITPSNSGTTINTLNIIQTGDRLEAIANDGLIYRGTIGNFVSNAASFNLSGTTGGGQSATLTGTIRVDGSTARLTGTWIEPGLFATADASADVTVVTPTSTPTTNTVSTATGG